MTTLVTYTCPSCGVMLEAESDGWQDWRLCPACSKPGRPPYIRPTTATTQVFMEDVLYIGVFPEPSLANANTSSPTPAPAPTGHAANPYGRPVQPQGTPLTSYPPPANSVQPQRLLLGGGFFFAMVLTLISLLQQNGTQAGVLGMVALFLLVLLARSTRFD